MEFILLIWNFLIDVLKSQTFWIALSIVVSAWCVINQIKSLHKLQKKDVAIRLIYENRLDPLWYSALQHLFEKFEFEENYDWRDLARKRFDKDYERTEDEVELSNAVRDVLNSYEFIAVAILDETADEHIIKHAQKSTIINIYRNLKPFIEYISKEVQPSAYVNLKTLVEKWDPPPDKPKPVTPG